MEIKLLNKIDDSSNNEKVVLYIRENSRIDYNENNFVWQYDSEESVFGVIQDNNSILGTQGMISVNLFNNNNIFLSHKSETTYLSESIRGLGLFEKLYKCCVNECKEKGSQYIWGFTALSKVWRNKLEFQVDENLIFESEIIISSRHQWIQFFNNPKNLKEFGKVMYCFFKECNFKVKKILKKRKILKEIFIKPSANLEYDISKLILKTEKYNQFYSLNYSNLFLEKRILNSPFNKYNSLVVYNNNNEPLAIAIYTTNNGRFRISECLYNNEESLNQLIRSVIKLAIDQKQSKISFFGNIKNSIYQKVFELMESYGSKTTRCADMNFVLLSCAGTKKNQYSNLHNWLINGLWTEGYSY